MSTNFSPKGDFMVTGGSDCCCMVWSCPLDGECHEEIDDLKDTKTVNNVTKSKLNTTNASNK